MSNIPNNKPKLNIKKLIRNIIIVVILLAITLFILKIAPNYTKLEDYTRTNLIINNNNVTTGLKKDLIIENDVIYLSRQDVKNFFDPYIYYNDAEKRIVTTYDTKVASLILDKNITQVNSSDVNINATAFERDNTIYLPFSELKNIYNVEINYNKDSNIITFDSLRKEQIKATAKKNLSVKSRAKTLSSTVDKVKKSDSVIVIWAKDGWSKVRTSDGFIGYIKENNLVNHITVRETIKETPQIEGKINLVWDYYSEYVTAPDRSGTTIDGVNVVSPTFFALERLGKGNIIDKVGTAGQKYIDWAKSNNYKVWGLVANESMIETTSEIVNSYELRSKTIDNIIDLAVKYKLDGINIDFEYMYEKDKDMFSQFIIELHPRLKEIGLVLSVDVTAPDGSENWSMCYDRNVIAKNSDYIVFMAYDQYGTSSNKAGTTAGYDWVKVNLNKFLKTEEIEPSKIILGIPLYTRMWTETPAGKVTSAVVDMKNVDKSIPASVQRTWLDDVKQNYVEFTDKGNTKKMWIEDEQSIRAKLSLIKENNLAGAAFWAKGRESDNIWSVVKEELFT